jgi:hypothetical protein
LAFSVFTLNSYFAGMFLGKTLILLAQRVNIKRNGIHGPLRQGERKMAVDVERWDETRQGMTWRKFFLKTSYFFRHEKDSRYRQ